MSNWIVAAAGKEPVMTIEGKRYQYMFDTMNRRHAYYCFEDDMFLTDGLEYLLPECLRK